MISYIKCSSCGQNLSNSFYTDVSKKFGVKYNYSCARCNKRYSFNQFVSAYNKK